LNVVIAVDSFGQFANAHTIAARISETISAVGHTPKAHPLSDGGEGMVSALGAHRDLLMQHIEVPGPFDTPVNAIVGWYGEMAVIESAQACGWPALRGDSLNPLEASSEGVGKLLRSVAQRTDGPVQLGLGGSVTVDGGLGALINLGLVALDANGHRVKHCRGLAGLSQVKHLVGQPNWDDRLLEILTDVQTPLYEAPRIYGPQKGLSKNHITEATAHFKQWGDVLQRWRQDHGYAPMAPSLPGGGAAGGLGYALAAVLNTGLYPGARRIARMTGLNRAIAKADCVITGEGKLDASTYEGKVTDIVIQMSRAQKKPVWAVVGQATDSRTAPQGPDRIFVSTGSETPEERLDDALTQLRDALKCHKVE